MTIKGGEDYFPFTINPLADRIELREWRGGWGGVLLLQRGS